MIYDLQKASVLKRISASLLDVILTLIIATGIFFTMSGFFNYDTKLDEYNASVDVYEESIKQYDIQIGDKKYSEITPDLYKQLTREEREIYDANKVKMETDQVAIDNYRTVLGHIEKLVNLTLLMLTFGFLIAILLTEFVVPLILQNGQTVGKKMFGICLMMDNGVKVGTLPLFIRAILGKFTVETMIIVYALIQLFFGQPSILVILLAVAVVLTDIIMIMTSYKNAFIHDVMSYTVVVDKTSQMIFETEEELIKYKEEQAKKAASSKKTF